MVVYIKATLPFPTPEVGEEFRVFFRSVTHNYFDSGRKCLADFALGARSGGGDFDHLATPHELQTKVSLPEQNESTSVHEPPSTFVASTFSMHFKYMSCLLSSFANKSTPTPKAQSRRSNHSSHSTTRRHEFWGRPSTA